MWRKGGARIGCCRMRRHRAGRRVGLPPKDQPKRHRAFCHFGQQFLDSAGKTRLHKFEYESIGRDQHKGVVLRCSFRHQSTNPRVELLCRHFLLKATQAGFPEARHEIEVARRTGRNPNAPTTGVEDHGKGGFYPQRGKLSTGEPLKKHVFDSGCRRAI